MITYQIANSEPIIVREMLHDVLDAALEDVAELVDGIDLHVLIVPEPIELGAVYIIMGIKIVFGKMKVSQKVSKKLAPQMAKK